MLKCLRYNKIYNYKAETTYNSMEDPCTWQDNDIIKQQQLTILTNISIAICQAVIASCEY